MVTVRFIGLGPCPRGIPSSCEIVYLMLPLGCPHLRLTCPKWKNSSLLPVFFNPSWLSYLPHCSASGRSQNLGHHPYIHLFHLIFWQIQSFIASKSPENLPPLLHLCWHLTGINHQFPRLGDSFCRLWFYFHISTHYFHYSIPKWAFYYKLHKMQSLFQTPKKPSMTQAFVHSPVWASSLSPCSSHYTSVPGTHWTLPQQGLPACKELPSSCSSRNQLCHFSALSFNVPSAGEIPWPRSLSRPPAYSPSLHLVYSLCSTSYKLKPYIAVCLLSLSPTLQDHVCFVLCTKQYLPRIGYPVRICGMKKERVGEGSRKISSWLTEWSNRHWRL